MDIWISGVIVERIETVHDLAEVRRKWNEKKYIINPKERKREIKYAEHIEGTKWDHKFHPSNIAYK